MVERIVVGSLYTNCYIFFSGKKECYIIDPGGDSETICKRLLALNMIPKAMIFTHGHLDHTASALDIHVKYTTQDIEIQTAVHELDMPYFGRTAEKTHRRSFENLGKAGEDMFSEIFRGIPDVTIKLKEGDKILDSDLLVIHTPGHTKGSISLYSESKGILFTGDTLFCEGVGRTDLHGGNQKDLENSIRNKLYVLPPATRIFPGHGPQSSLEREMNHNPYIRLH